MSTPVRTSAEALRAHFPGELITAGVGPAWQDLLVEIHARPASEDVLFVPAVPEPQIVCLLEGAVSLEEREIGGDWSRLQAEPGDLFLTTSPAPYEVRWENVGPTPLLIMQVFVGLPLLAEATRDVLGSEAQPPVLREFSGRRDGTMQALLEQLRLELVERQPASPLFVQSVARCLRYIVRAYGEPNLPRMQPRPGLTAFQLRKVNELLEARLDENLHLADLAREAGISEFHFSRLFKKTTGLSPSQYSIRLRIARARRLLLETEKNVLEVSLDVGYSSASHFTDVFRREMGVTPTEYRARL